MATKTDNQQLAFHAWLSRRGIALKYAGDGQYEPRVQLAWEAWTTAVDEMRHRAAVEADRQDQFRDATKMVPSDEEIEACGSGGPMSLVVALDFADNPRPHGSLAAPADTDGELYKALRVLAAEYRALLSRYGSGQPAASAEPSESVVLLDALSGLVKALRERHYGRMPDEVQAAYDKAWAIVFSSPVAAPVAQEPLKVLAYRIKRTGDLPGSAWIDGAPAPDATGTEILWSDGYIELAYAAPAAAQAQHPDDAAVDRFAVAMKDKLAQARAKGRHGWHECPPEDLSTMLRAHVEKGDPRDVANFCMFLWSLGHPISAAPTAQEPMQSDSFSACAIGDSNYAAGMLLGWNLCIDGNEEKFNQTREARLRAAAQASRASKSQEVAPVAAQAQQIHPAIREAVESAFEQRPGWLEKIGAAVRYLPDVAAQVQPAMPPLTEAMRTVLRNEHCVYDSEDALYAALCDAAQAQPTIRESLKVAQDHDAGLADTQRAIIEAAERRGYERAIAECAQVAREAKGADHA